MKSLLITPYEVAFRSEIDGVDVKRLATDFWSIPSLPAGPEYIHISLTEPAEFAPKTINVDLAPGGCSFYVSSADDVWVDGTYLKLDRWFGRKRSVWRTLFEKHGLNVNGVALLLALTLGPDLDIGSRTVLVFGTLIGTVVFFRVHASVTRLRIFLRQDYAKATIIDLPRLLTMLLGAALIGAVGWLYALLSGGGLRSLLEWLARGTPPA